MKISRRLKIAFGFGAILVSVAALAPVAWKRINIRLYGPQVEFSAKEWAALPLPAESVSMRQRMLRDLLINVLPGKSRAEVEELLGESPTHESMRRRVPEGLVGDDGRADATAKPFPKKELGYYDDAFNWDLMYVIGIKQNEFGNSPLLDTSWEVLIIRFDTNDIFSSWYVIGSPFWPEIVGVDGVYSPH